MNSFSKGHSPFTVEVPAPRPRQDFLFLSFNLDILELTWNFSIYTAQVWRRHVSLSLEFWQASQHQRCARLGLSQMLYWWWCLPRKLSHLASQCRAAPWSLFSRSTHLHCICCPSDHLCFPLYSKNTGDWLNAREYWAPYVSYFSRETCVIFWMLQNRGVGLQGKVHCKLPNPYAF